jgi:hypothetical protein
MSLLNLLLFFYILVPIAFIVMLKNYRTTNWMWLGFLLLGLPLGIAPYVAVAYLVSSLLLGKNKGKSTETKATYYPDGSYIIYKAEDTQSAPSAGKVAFRIIGGLVAGAALCFGLFIIGIMIFVSVSCGGNSKCM